jgi:hypothetical protein
LSEPREIWPWAIEACATWPEGDHRVCRIARGGRWPVAVLRALPALTKRAIPGLFPEHFDPVGDVERGEARTLGASGLMVETIDGAHYARVALDLVRLAFPGVRWRLGAPVEPSRDSHGNGSGPGGAPRVAYGCLAGRVVGVLMEIRTGGAS